MRDLIIPGTDKDTTHSYVDVYQELFQDIYDTDTNVL